MYVHVLFYRLDFISFCFIIVYTLYCFQNNMQLRLIKPRYLRGNENPSMEEQTIQWTKQKVKKSKQLSIRRVCIYQRGNQNPYIKEEQTTQWPKEKVQKDKQRSTKHTYKTKDRVTRTPLNTGGEFRCPGRVGSTCSTSCPCVTIVKKSDCKS